MFVPTFDNDVSVLVNYSFYFAEISRFDTLLLGKNCLSATKIGIIFDTTHISTNYLL